MPLDQKQAPPEKKNVKKNPKKASANSAKTVGSSTAAYATQRTTAIGDMLYALGFYAEYFVLRFWRLIRDAVAFIGQILVWLFGGFFGGLFGFFGSIFRDIAAPFVRMAAGIRNMRTVARQEKRKGNTRVAGQVARYFGRGVKSYGHLLLNIFRFLVPLAASVALVFTVYTLFSMEYALAVEVHGEVIGYVSDEIVLEEAQRLLRMKITLAPDQTLDDWDFSPKLSIATTNTLSNRTEIADGILRSEADNIVEANGLYVNGVLVGATTEGDELRTLLGDMLQDAQDPAHPDAKIDFVDTVEVSEDGGVYLTESVQPFEAIKEEITSIETPAVTYTARGETLLEIAHTNNITLDQLRMRNPAIADEEEDYAPPDGTSLIIRNEEPYLQIQMAYTHSEEEVIPFEEERVESADYVTGREVVDVEGEEGLRRLWFDYVYVDGELVEKEPLDDRTEIIKEPVNRLVYIGTRERESLTENNGGGITGNYLWPVPDAIYSSRGFIPGSHRGLDINAPTGTPIYASNGGVVVTSGWHYSWGNYIQIDHGNGLHTLYAHCSALYVVEGQVVGQDQLIAAVGSTGYSTGPHCHFEVLVDGVSPVDPDQYVTAPW